MSLVLQYYQHILILEIIFSGIYHSIFFTSDDKDTPPAKKQKKNREKSTCPHYKSSLINQLRDQSLLKVQDIEQLVIEGRKIGACPYYASRKAVEDAQVVVVPYNTLLHSSTRKVVTDRNISWSASQLVLCSINSN